jgi:ribonuclease Z
MTWLVQSRLVNQPFGDPGLFVDFRFGRRALLFDLGELQGLSPRELLRVSHVFISHTHMDHFVGFDRLLRVSLYRPVPIRLVGPPGFIAAVDAKLRAYSWNLLDERSADFALHVAEVTDCGFVAATLFRAREGFRARPVPAPDLAPGTVLEEEEFRVETAVLDHGIPCLAFAFQEQLRVNVLKEGLAQLGLAPGPWLNDAKRAMRQGASSATPITAGPDRIITLGELAQRALRTGPGQRLAYVVDTGFDPPNLERILALAANADQLFIEAGFLDADRALAAAKRHLTARQAGEIARLAGAARVTPLHFSTRYEHCPEALRQELEAAFGGVTSQGEVVIGGG